VAAKAKMAIPPVTKKPASIADQYSSGSRHTANAHFLECVALRLHRLPSGVAKPSAVLAEVPACQPISLRAANGTKTARTWPQIRRVRSILSRPLPMWSRRQTLRTVLLITCPADGAGGRRGLQSTGRPLSLLWRADLQLSAYRGLSANSTCPAKRSPRCGAR